MNSLEFIIIVLAVWRVTHLFQAEDGPGDIIVRIRKRLGDGFVGSMMDCFCCLSIWVALPFGLYFGKGWPWKIILWLAFSGAAVLLEKISPKEQRE
jgi:hypothetical protein